VSYLSGIPFEPADEKVRQNSNDRARVRVEQNIQNPNVLSAAPIRATKDALKKARSLDHARRLAQKLGQFRANSQFIRYHRIEHFGLK
jgi:hypothetical protein